MAWEAAGIVSGRRHREPKLKFTARRQHCVAALKASAGETGNGVADHACFMTDSGGTRSTHFSVDAGNLGRRA